MLRVEHSATRPLKTSGLVFLFEPEGRRRSAYDPATELDVASPFQFLEAAMTTKHSEAFIEQALVKAYSRGKRTIKSVAQDLNVSYHTLKY